MLRNIHPIVILSIVCIALVFISCGKDEEIFSPVDSDNLLKVKVERDTLSSIMPTTTIRFEMPAKGYVSLKIYNSEWQQVGVLINNELLDAGVQEAVFNAELSASGVYYFQLRAGRSLDNEGRIKDILIEVVKKMLLVK